MKHLRKKLQVTKKLWMLPLERTFMLTALTLVIVYGRKRFAVLLSRSRRRLQGVLNHFEEEDVSSNKKNFLSFDLTEQKIKNLNDFLFSERRR